MHIILGGTGRVGAAVADALVAQGEAVTIVTRDRARLQEVPRDGRRLAIADVDDPASLRPVLATGTRLFLLNPPADPATNIDIVERQRVRSILTAMQGVRLEHVVAVSTYGAQPHPHSGDLGVLHEMEEQLETQPVPSTIVRAAYYMTNWDGALQTAVDEGLIHSLLPLDLALPMVSPRDVGTYAAGLMLEPPGPGGIHHVEGPSVYTPRDVARAFASALDQPVEAVAVPREAWASTLRALGFSEPAAQSYAGMTALTVDRLARPADPVRGPTSIDEHVRAVVVSRR